VLAGLKAAREKDKGLEDAEEAVVDDPVSQGAWLTGGRHEDGTLLSAPNRFTWGRNEACYHLDVADGGARYFAYNQEKPPPALVWRIVRRLSLPVPIVIVSGTGSESKQFAAYFRQVAVNCAVIPGPRSSQRDGLTAGQQWQRFQTEPVDVCVMTTGSANNNRVAVQLLVVSTKLQDPWQEEAHLLGKTHTLVFFDGDRARLIRYCPKAALTILAPDTEIERGNSP
jgi:hypothetical protein